MLCAGADRQRRRLLKTVPIVGVTCCSSLLAALDGQRFDLVLLDECSQMVEPLSLVPLLRAQARCAGPWGRGQQRRGERGRNGTVRAAGSHTWVHWDSRLLPRPSSVPSLPTGSS